MSNNAGKGDTPRPFSVDRDTYASNWDKVFGDKPDAGYVKMLNSGMFWEFFPGLTGNWDEDKVRWTAIRNGDVHSKGN